MTTRDRTRKGTKEEHRRLRKALRRDTPRRAKRVEAVGANGFTVAQSLADFRRNWKKPGARAEAIDGFTRGVQRLRDVNYLLGRLNVKHFHNEHATPDQKHLQAIAESYTTLTVGLAKMLWPRKQVK